MPKLFQDSPEDKQSDVKIPIPSNELPTATHLFSQAWNIYTKNFVVLIGIYLIPLIFVGVGFLLLYIAQKNSNLSILIPIVSALGLFMIYLLVWAVAALIKASQTLIENEEPITIPAVYNDSKNKVWQVAGAGLLALLATVGGLILFIIPGITFFVWFGLGQCIVVAEDGGIIKALKSGKQYAKGRFGSILWRWVVIFFAYTVFSIVITVIATALGTIYSLQKTTTSNIINLTVGLFITPFFVVYSYLLYYQLKKSVR